MVTVLREAGFRFAIYLSDHFPEHVHVYGDGEAKIEFAGDGSVKVVWSYGMKAGDLRRAVRIVEAHRETIVRHWRDMHG